ncbi:uncharacterized protein H6S33_011058 [Morchella sextelata]|jgi:hypothetical protein|uniref:uncharacterized protein n=1 Tax=Morchella sextelata TaxID=1174677 RepID=UPI001D05736B|nr:uncharacterized protein H6S33_011058 [Morchella sextelata]KAH0611793.1 hypothetical protein H6S33_011058 [Morchella sextelata]
MSISSQDQPTLKLSARGPDAAKENPNELEAFLALSITCVDDPTGPEIFDDEASYSPEVAEYPANENYDGTKKPVEVESEEPTSEDASTGTEKPALFAPGATLRRQRHRRVVTKDWRDFIATVEQKEDGSLVVPGMKEGEQLPLMCHSCGAELEDDEPHCQI